MLVTICALSPELKVLLVARQAARIVASFASSPVHEATTHAKHGWNHSRRTVAAIVPTSTTELRLQRLAPSSIPETNPALAAAHKVGMDVLTEYGNSQQEQPRPRRPQDDGSGRASQPATKLQPAWGSIAVGALEHLGSVDLDHDHGR